MPLQLERRRQFIEAFIENFHNAVVAAIERDFADPDRAPRFNLHGRVWCNDPGSAHPTKTFPHTFKNSRAIVAPLILIVVSDKIGHSFPVSAFDRMEEIFGVQPDLMPRLPKPEQIQPKANRERQSAKESATKRDRHTRELILSPRLYYFKGRPFVRPLLARRRANRTLGMTKIYLD